MFEDKKYIDQLLQERRAIDNDNLQLRAELQHMHLNASRLQVYLPFAHMRSRGRVFSLSCLFACLFVCPPFIGLFVPQGLVIL